ncbi:MAG: hypothetical protein KBT27_09975, partial [Prevotellaceae bacterium]|nr:hypothetical protein [Candidatus Faecinaster equi]
RTDRTEYGVKAESPHAEWCLFWFTFKGEKLALALALALFGFRFSKSEALFSFSKGFGLFS